MYINDVFFLLFLLQQHLVLHDVHDVHDDDDYLPMLLLIKLPQLLLQLLLLYLDLIIIKVMVFIMVIIKFQ